MRALAGLLTVVWWMASPASAQQSWLPVVSSAQAASSGPDLEQGWFPVVINPPRLDDVAPEVSPSPTIVAQAKKAPATEQRQVQPVAQPPPPQAPPPPPEKVSKPVEAPREKSGPAQEYCVSIADAAADARFAWQKQTLGEMEKELERRIVILETRTAEYREWLARRDAFVEKAQESLVRIYARMRPDAAASQLAAMDEETAAAVLTKLNPRSASAILNEMPPGPAARLTSTIAGAAKVDNADESSAPAADGGRT
jgi:flagellar motility protein MotE (MotC chaperone)